MVNLALYHKHLLISQGLLHLAPKAMNVNVGLVGSEGDTWRTGRHTLTPSFSAMKMKLVRVSQYCYILYQVEGKSIENDCVHTTVSEQQ